MEKMEKMKKHERLFWSAFTAILTNALIQYGWLAFVIVLVIIFLAVAGYELIQADKEQKTKAEAEAKAKAEAEAEAKAEAEDKASKLADKLAKALEKIEALEAKLQGSKKGGDENEQKR